jgi:hypothetical protein
MRIALANCHRQVVGGAESYIKAVVLELESAGHEVATARESSCPPARPLGPSAKSVSKPGWTRCARGAPT